MNFSKYQGTGNDFILIDNRNQIFPPSNTNFIKKLCDRRFGIGADGLILLENETGFDFKMVYFNSDGNQSSMCGNGGRCLVSFAKRLKIIFDKANFSAVDGSHFATISDIGIVSLQMKNVSEVKTENDYVFLNTGSPHHVEFVDDLENCNVKEKGRTIRHSDLYGNEGSNINFITQIALNHFAIRTYERGVEDETLSCGTGATAVAIAMFHTKKTNSKCIDIDVLGGKLNVKFEENNEIFTDVFLEGPAEFVFDGTLNLEQK